MGLIADYVASTGGNAQALAPPPRPTTVPAAPQHEPAGILDVLTMAFRPSTYDAVISDVATMVGGLGAVGAMGIGDIGELLHGDIHHLNVLTPNVVPMLVAGQIQDWKDRYGPIGHGDFSGITEHPGFLLADAALVAGAGGAVARGAAGVGKMGEVARLLGTTAEAQASRAAAIQSFRGLTEAERLMTGPRLSTLAEDAGRFAQAKAGVLDAITGSTKPAIDAPSLLAAGQASRYEGLTSLDEIRAAVQATPRSIRVLDRLLPPGDRWVTYAEQPPLSTKLLGKEPPPGYRAIEMRVADPIAGKVYDIHTSHNPLVNALYTVPIKRRLLSYSRGFLADEFRTMTRAVESGQIVNPYELERIRVALERADAGGAELIASKPYHAILARRQLQSYVGNILKNGIVTRKAQAVQMAAALEGATDPGNLHYYIQGLRDGDLNQIVPDVLVERLSEKGYPNLVDAARDVLYDTDSRPGGGPALHPDEKATLLDMAINGKIDLPESYRYDDPLDLTPELAPERARYKMQMFEATARAGMDPAHQNFSMAWTDVMARSLADTNPEFGGNVDAVYAKLGMEFVDKFATGVERSFAQRGGRLYRGAVSYDANGNPVLDARRMVRWFRRGMAKSPEMVDWYTNGHRLIAGLTEGMSTTFIETLADGTRVRRTINDAQLLTDILAVTSIGTMPDQNFLQAWDIYSRFKKGQLRLERTDVQGVVAEGEALANLRREMISTAPLRRWVADHPEVIPPRGAPGSDAHRLRQAFDIALKRERISVENADRFAVERLGVHPSSIWGDEFYGSTIKRGPVRWRIFDENGDEVRGLLAGKAGNEKGRMLNELLSGHLISDWEEEIKLGVAGDLPIEEVMKRFRSDRGQLSLNNRQKVRAFAANLRLEADRATIDRRIGLFFGVFTGDAQWRKAFGELKEEWPTDVIRNQIGNVGYRQMERWLQEVQHELNRNLPPGRRFQLFEVQSVLWGQAVDFVREELGRVNKALKSEVDLDGSPLSPSGRQTLDDYRKLLEAAGTDKGADARDYAHAWESIADGPMGTRFEHELRAKFGETTVTLAQTVANDIKGQIMFGDDMKAVIQLAKTSDFTTLVHESGHFLRANLPQEEADRLWQVYHDLVGDIPDSDQPLTQTVHNPRARGQYASVDTSHGEVHEGMYVSVGPRDGPLPKAGPGPEYNLAGVPRVVKLYQIGERFFADLDNGKKGIDVEELRPVPELDPYKMGLSEPTGFKPEESIATNTLRAKPPFRTSGGAAHYERYTGSAGVLRVGRDGVEDIAVPMRVNYTPGGGAIERVEPWVKIKGQWQRAAEAAGEAVPQVEPGPSRELGLGGQVRVDVASLPKPEHGTNLERMAQDPLAGAVLQAYRNGRDFTDEQMAKFGTLRTAGETEGYFLMHQDGPRSDMWYVVSKEALDSGSTDPKELFPDAAQSAYGDRTKRPHAPDAPRWGKVQTVTPTKAVPKNVRKAQREGLLAEGGEQLSDVPIEKPAGLERLKEDISAPPPPPGEMPFTVEAPAEVIDRLNELFDQQFSQPGDKLLPGHPLYEMAKRDPAIYVTEPGITEDGRLRAFEVPNDVAPETPVIFAGSNAKDANYGVVHIVDPEDVLHGNEGHPKKWGSLEDVPPDQFETMPVVYEIDGKLIAEEGNHRIEVARRWGQDIPMVVVRVESRAVNLFDEVLPDETKAAVESAMTAVEGKTWGRGKGAIAIVAEEALPDGGVRYQLADGTTREVAATAKPAMPPAEPTPRAAPRELPRTTDPAEIASRLESTGTDPKIAAAASKLGVDDRVAQMAATLAVQATKGNPNQRAEVFSRLKEATMVERMRAQLDEARTRVAPGEEARVGSAEPVVAEPPARTPVAEPPEVQTEGAPEMVRVTLPNGSTVVAEVIGRNPEAGIVKLKMPDGSETLRYENVVSPAGPGGTGTAPLAGPSEPVAPPGVPPTGGVPVAAAEGPPPGKLWTRPMEEAFAEELEKWVYNKVLPADERLHPAFRTLKASLANLWQRVRGWALEHHMIDPESAQTFDRYFGKAFEQPDVINHRLNAGQARWTRLLPDVPPLAHPAFTGQEPLQMTGDLSQLGETAAIANQSLRRKLLAAFKHPANFATKVKDAAGLDYKLRNGLNPVDALQARVFADSWATVDDVVSRLEAQGLQVVGGVDTRAVPGRWGERGVKVYVQDPDVPGFVSEIEIGTPLYNEVRDASWWHQQAANQNLVKIETLNRRIENLQQQIDQLVDPEEQKLANELNKQLDDALEELDKAYRDDKAYDRMLKGVWGMVADEVDQSFGGPGVGGPDRQVMNRLRLWTMKNIEQDMLRIGYWDPEYAFERQYYPLMKQRGAVFDQETGKWVGGGDPYTLDMERDLQGLPPAAYFPHMAPPIKLSEWITQRGRGMTGARKLAENKSLKRWTGALMEPNIYGEPSYLTDVEQAYLVRASRALKMSDTWRIVDFVTQNYGRLVSDPHALGNGERLYAPDFQKALFRAVIKVDDEMGRLLKALPTDLLTGQVLTDLTTREGAQRAIAALAEGLKKQGVREVEMGALMRAIETAIPRVQREFVALTSRGVKLYAIPEAVAKALDATVNRASGGGAVRLFYDSPINLWRNLTLYGRPAWMLNNFFGNMAFLKLGRGRFTDVVRQVFDPEFRDMAKQLADQVPGVDIGYYGSQVEHYVPKLGSAATDASGEVLAAMQAASSKSKVFRPFHVWKDAVNFLQEVQENYFRRAGLIRALENEYDPVKVRGIAKRFWAQKKDMEQMLVGGIPEQSAGRLLDEVNRWFGDFSTMSPFERNVIRRFLFPFWGFYRHVLRMFFSMPTEYPARFAVMRAVSQLGQEMNAEFGELPDWMASAAPMGAINPSGDTTFVSSGGPNPFNILMDSPMSALNPMLKVPIERAIGRDIFTDRPFSDPNTIVPYGSDQPFKIIRDASGMPIDAQPTTPALPPIGVHMMSQVPQYDLIRNLLAGGRAYDTQGILAGLSQGPVIDSSGNAVRPVGLGESVMKYMGVSTFPFDVGAYQARAEEERQAALAYAIRQWRAAQ